MRSVSTFESIFIHRDFVDMRKSIQGLAVIVEKEMGRSLTSNSLFIFCNKKRTHLKMLYFDRSGFALWLKRLEVEKFSWLKANVENNHVEITSKDLELLLDGVNVWSRFESVCFQGVV